MWVLKLGGSLERDPLLPQWLALVGQLGGGRIVLVCGGGTFADQVRSAQQHWRFDDLAAHNMAVLAMMQSAYLAQGLEPALRSAASASEIRRVLRAGHAAVWMPTEWLRNKPDEHTNWDLSSDSMALHMAGRLNAERLIVVKSCAVDHQASWAQLGEAGVLDARFATLARSADFPISVVHKTELAWVRELLLGAPRAAPN